MSSREGIVTSLVRGSAFVRKELLGAARQPKLIIFLVLGPFGVLLLFGMGLRDTHPPLRTAFVVPPESPVTEEVERFAELRADRLDVRSIGSDVDAAVAALERGELHVVMAFPANVGDTVAGGDRAVITVHHDIVDPIEERVVRLFASGAVDRVNRLVVSALVRGAQQDVIAVSEEVEQAREEVEAVQDAIDRDDTLAVVTGMARVRRQVTTVATTAGPTVAVLDALSEATGSNLATTGRVRSSVETAVDSAQQAMDAEEVEERQRHLTALSRDLATMADALETFRDTKATVLISPYRVRVRTLSEQTLELTDYYAPAVVAVLLQHMVITFMALSFVQEHRQGSLELFRVAPVRAGEVLAGKYVAQLALGLGVAAVLLPLLTIALDVPMEGSWVQAAGVAAATLFASAGLGLLIGLLADSEIQAVQYAMMVLLATVFLSGFLLSLERFVPQVGWVAWLLPATYGIRTLREVMLRGSVQDPTVVAALLGIGVLLLIVGWALLGRRLHRA